MAEINKDIVKVDSNCYFLYELKDEMGDGTGYWACKTQGLHSRTFFPKGTVVHSHKEFKELAKEIKKGKKLFKHLDDEIKDKFKEEKLDDKIEKPKIGGEAKDNT